jgi:Ca2+/Na+ antiporter
LPKRTVTDLKLKSFIRSKKVVSLVLLTLLTGASTLSISNWLIDLYKDGYVKNIDNVFFNQFFTLLILTDVIILLISFRYTEEYSKLIRNTGFIISTILIRLSFSADGFLSIILILTGVSFALLILIIYNAIENPKLDSTV